MTTPTPGAQPQDPNNAWAAPEPAPAAPYPPAALAPKKNTIALVALIVGIIGIFTAFLPIVAVAAIILGIIGLVKAKHYSPEWRRKWMAITGIVLGVIGVAIPLVFWLWFQHSQGDFINEVEACNTLADETAKQECIQEATMRWQEENFS
ncbi:DUF4190 domain-containing protein [Corynebacterium choanae]|uniref:DUF4190 domain-containing protein n=1 Tax=Corynebacterium choanae TaxID=1862358 RepID=A0A3G6J814_9CORY|nr:DUF4190 domain-containing protein [Corynebacterium choanae]AZA14251.1 hypothetical protein CCHOA_09340 [Corynebacterium choanae]